MLTGGQWQVKSRYLVNSRLWPDFLEFSRAVNLGLNKSLFEPGFEGPWVFSASAGTTAILDLFRDVRFPADVEGPARFQMLVLCAIIAACDYYAASGRKAIFAGPAVALCGMLSDR